MLKNKLGKKITALISAAVMAASATATGISALSAYADETLNTETGEGTFEDGSALPWHICESATGAMKFDIVDGIYAVYIENCGGLGNGGEGRWDCQFRHRNLTIEVGHQYRITYSVWTDTEGTFYTKLGDMTDDDCENWHMNGTMLTMDYLEGASQDELYSALTSASSNGTFYEYWQGWDSWKSASDLRAYTNQWNTWAWEFTVDGSDSHMHTTSGIGEWTFHLGGTSAYNSDICFDSGTTLMFDNLMLVDMTDNSSNYIVEDDYVASGVEVNQVGYYTNAKKLATLIVDEGDTTQYDYTITDASGSVVYSGITDGVVSYDKAAWNYNQVIDFTDFTTEGTNYTLNVAGKTSVAFDIDDELYQTYYDEDLLTYALNYFYQARSGVETLEAYIPSDQTDEAEGGTVSLARKDNHNPDTCYITDEWIYIYTSMPSTSKGSIDATGGWYDAGDYGKYVVNGGISLWTLMNMYEHSLKVDRDNDIDVASKWDDNSGLMYLPEAGNDIPDILDECQVELDFFLEMQRDDGMVYHKVHDYKWTALAVAPYADSESACPTTYSSTVERADSSTTPLRIVKPVTYAATLNFAACCAQAARLFEDYDASYASTLLSAAKKAYEAAVDNYQPFSEVGFVTGEGVEGGMYAPTDQDKGGGAYGDDNVSDEFYWAACELYITTGDSYYYDELYKYGTGAYGDTENGSALEISTTLYGGENEGTTSLFTWGTLNSVGSISLYVNSDLMLEEGLLSESEVQTLKDQVINAADYYLDVQAESSYSTPYKGMDYEASVWTFDTSTNTGTTETVILEGGYEWGSNSMVINNAIAMALAYDETGDVEYIDGVTTAFDYLLGRNSIEQSFVTGYGEHSTQYPHHRWWSGQIDNTNFPYAPYGVLSGGQNSNMNDPMIQGMGYAIGEIAPMVCYLDNVEAWSVNEVTINWNAPLCWVVSFIDDEAPNIERGTLSLSYDDTSLEVGETANPTVTSNGETVTDMSSLTFSSDDTSVVTVDANGIVTAVGEGSAKIIVTDSEGNTATATIKVTESSTTDDTTTSSTDTITTTTTTTTSTSDTDNTSDTDSTTTVSGDTIWGDVNLDGTVTLADDILLMKYINGSVDLNAQALLNADCNSDNGVQATDAFSLYRFLVKVIDALPE